MANAKTGVYPCYENQFKVGASGEATPSTTIANCEEFSIAFNNGVEEWTPFESGGWKKRLMTAKDISISVKAKRTIGDAGNDMIAGMFMKNGEEAQVNFLWTFPDGSTLLLANAVVNITANGGGPSTGVAPLEFDVMSNGKPTYTPAK